MTRCDLPNGRAGTRVIVEFKSAGGHDNEYPVTFNRSEDGGRVIECFISQDDRPEYKTGSQLLALLQDGCRLASRCLRHGDTIQELADYCGEDRGEGATEGTPSSIIGAIARAGAELEGALS